MARITIDLNRLVTKSEYARMIEKTPQYVNKLTNSNKLDTIEIGGVEFVLLPTPKEN